jgi:hypothetical protein
MTDAEQDDRPTTHDVILSQRRRICAQVEKHHGLAKSFVDLVLSEVEWISMTTPHRSYSMCSSLSMHRTWSD